MTVLVFTILILLGVINLRKKAVVSELYREAETGNIILQLTKTRRNITYSRHAGEKVVEFRWNLMNCK